MSWSNRTTPRTQTFISVWNNTKALVPTRVKISDRAKQFPARSEFFGNIAHVISSLSVKCPWNLRISSKKGPIDDIPATGVAQVSARILFTRVYRPASNYARRQAFFNYDG